MITLQDWVKYIGIAFVSYFLIKAFACNKLSEKQILLIVLGIMIMVVLIASQNFNCSNKKEGFEVVSVVTENPVNINHGKYQYHNNMSGTNNCVGDYADGYVDDDVEDFKDIVEIDKEVYEQIKIREKDAMIKITDKYQDEMVYTTAHPFNTVPLGSKMYGYTYLPPENWFRAYERPPVCVGNHGVQIQPVGDCSIDGLLEFDSRNNTLGPMGINVRYVKEVLNREKN